MRRIIIKGSCKEIDRNINYILTLCRQSEEVVKLVGIMCDDRSYEHIDGIPCVDKSFSDYDYLIILDDKGGLKKQLIRYLANFRDEKIIKPCKKIFSLFIINGKKKWKKGNRIIDEVYEEEALLSENLLDNKIINSDILYTPGFDFKRYINLREDGVSIISNNCWGGLAYHYLGLPMKSPFINMWMLPDDYLRLVNNLEYYLSQKLQIVDSGYDKGRRRWYPIVALGDVKMSWNHCFTLKELRTSAKQFIKRSKRVDYDRLLAFLYFEGAGLAERYDKDLTAIPIKHKIGISHDYEGDNIYLATDYKKTEKRLGKYFFDYVNSTVERHKDAAIKPFDMLKLLNLEDDYLRI